MTTIVRLKQIKDYLTQFKSNWIMFNALTLTNKNKGKNMSELYVRTNKTVHNKQVSIFNGCPLSGIQLY